MNRFSKVFLAIAAALALLAMPVSSQISTTRDATAAFIKENTFLPSLARTASGDSGSPVDASAYAGGVVLVNVTAVSGTSPSMTVTFETCEDSTTTLCGYSHTASAAITATGKTLIKVNNFGRWVRVSYAITGTTPSFTFTAKGAFKPQT